MAKETYEGVARRPQAEAGKAGTGMRRVIVGKETGDDLNNPHAQIHTYVDEEGAFGGKIVSENAKNFIVEYPEEKYVQFQANVHSEAISRVTSSAKAGISNELGSGLQVKPGPTNVEVKQKMSSDG